MVVISDQQREAALQELAVPVRRPPMEQLLADHLCYLDLVQKETVEMPSVDGFDWKIYLVKAKNRAQNCPIYINVHGGGWFNPHQKSEDIWAAWLADRIRGIVVDVDYTTTKEAAYPVCFDQCYEAARWTVENAARLGGDPNRVSMGGDSAGGHLTAAVCLKAAETADFRLCLQMLAYPPLDLKTPAIYKPEGYLYEMSQKRVDAFLTLLFGNDPELAQTPYISPAYAPDELLSKTPQAVIISTGRCNFHLEDEDYAARLVSLGVEVTLKRFPNAIHGFLPHFRDEWKEAGRLIAGRIRCAGLDAL